MDYVEYKTLEPGDPVKFGATNEYGRVVRLLSKNGAYFAEVELNGTGRIVKSGYASLQKLKSEYAVDESKPEECPVCGSDKLVYGTFETFDNCIEYPWTCKNCLFTGAEYGTITFSGHELKDEGGYCL